MLKYLILLFCCYGSSLQRSTPEDDNYVAAVLEYAFTINSTDNLQNYLNYIQEAASQNADIVVFPELTLTSNRVPIPIHGLLKEYPNPAANPTLYDPVLVTLSEAAAANQIYVVLNVEEICDCTVNDQNEECPEAQIYYFNTNIVFDRNGNVIDRYRKINLFGEFSRTPALAPELGIFSTDFGVTFGHFICFDLQFQVPAIQLVEKYNITDVIFPTMWFSELPYLTAVQIQEAYAYALDINFLAAGANNVARGSAGSGIFSGKAGALISTMPGHPTSRLLVATVPKVPGLTTNYPGPVIDPPHEADMLYLKRDPSLASHETRLLEDGSQEFTLTDGDTSCHFRVRMTRGAGDVRPQFRAFAHEGSFHAAFRELATAGCSVVACNTTDPRTCGERYIGQATIQELEITMTSHKTFYNTTLKCENIVYFPTSFQNNHYPLSTKNYTFLSNTVNQRQKIDMALLNPQDELVSFGVFARFFIKDGIHLDKVTEDDRILYTNFENEIFQNHVKTEYNVDLVD